MEATGASDQRLELLLLGSWLLCLMLMQLLFGQEPTRLQTLQLGRDLALNIRLTELTLEHYPPALIKEFTGLDLVIAVQPPGPEQRRIQTMIDCWSCRSNSANACPIARCCYRQTRAKPRRSGKRPADLDRTDLTARAGLAAERTTEPTPLATGSHVDGDRLVGAVILTGVVYLLKEVERPLRGLERALARVGEGDDPAALPAQGSPEVQRITRRFNDMVQRLAANRRERATMLAGIAHDLRAPITRLQFRLALPTLDADEQERSRHDLESLERITGQFLLYAGGGERESPVLCPLERWIAEVVASYSSERLRLEATAVQARIRPIALARAVSNLIDNAFTYGTPPVVIRLLRTTNGISLEVWDQGSGVPSQDWSLALQPFQRLDEARGQQGHCGLGLAIVNHVMQHHNGTVTFRRNSGNPGRFAVVLKFPAEGLADAGLFRNHDSDEHP